MIPGDTGAFNSKVNILNTRHFQKTFSKAFSYKNVRLS